MVGRRLPTNFLPGWPTQADVYGWLKLGWIKEKWPDHPDPLSTATTPCWIASPAFFCIDREGYGRYVVRSDTGKRSSRLLHRVVYTILRGPIPPKHVLDHLCRQHSCCRPTHLEAVTMRTNTLRGISPPAVHHKKEFCPLGHRYTVRTGGFGFKVRYCNECRKERDRKKREAEGELIEA